MVYVIFWEPRSVVLLGDDVHGTNLFVDVTYHWVALAEACNENMNFSFKAYIPKDK